MKQVNISIHPFSALVGMAVLSMAWVTAAAMPLQGSSSDRDVSAIENVNEPHPGDYVRLVEGASYTVPASKILVLNCLYVQESHLLEDGGSRWKAQVSFDGALVFEDVHNDASDGTTVAIPPGLTAAAGTLVSVGDDVMYGQYRTMGALGYLVDA